jgi:hypothetical protein
MCPDCEGYEGCAPPHGAEADDEGFCARCHGTGYITASADSAGCDRCGHGQHAVGECRQCNCLRSKAAQDAGSNTLES